MSPINAYLVFDGNAAEAMRFYERTLPGGKLEVMMTHDQMPAQPGQADGSCPGGDPLPPGMGQRLMHGCLMFQNGMLMASDSMLGQPYEGMKGFGLALGCASNEQAQTVFDALAQGGQVTMPMQKTFWSERFGMLTDRFGTPWMVNGVMTPF